jgi:hypothetical protein
MTLEEQITHLKQRRWSSTEHNASVWEGAAIRKYWQFMWPPAHCSILLSPPKVHLVTYVLVADLEYIDLNIQLLSPVSYFLFKALFS